MPIAARVDAKGSRSLVGTTDAAGPRVVAQYEVTRAKRQLFQVSIITGKSSQ